MYLSLSCRIAEGFLSKEEASLSLPELSELATQCGYNAICMRASQIGVHSSDEAIERARQTLEQHALDVSMISGDFDIVYNNERGPQCLRNIVPYLDLAEKLGAPMIRVCIKTPDDLIAAKKASDQAAERGLHLVHQCHVQSLFETVDEILACLRKIDRPNFGLIFEAANLEQCGQDFGPPTIEKLAPWIRNVYLQNQKLHPAGAISLDTWCAGPVKLDLCEITDAGGIAFESVFAGLREVGYSGPVTVHQSAPQDATLTAKEAACTTAQYLRSIA